MSVDTPCREWQGATNTPNGYGQKWDKSRKKVVYVHRWVMAQIHGWEALEGKVVMHSCDNPKCYRYSHLQIGTHRDNAIDRDVKGRRRNQNDDKTHCHRGHPFDDTNTYIRPDGRRACRSCQRANEQKHRRNKS